MSELNHKELQIKLDADNQLNQESTDNTNTKLDKDYELNQKSIGNLSQNLQDVKSEIQAIKKKISWNWTTLISIISAIAVLTSALGVFFK